jgi:hypothetical protein
MAKNKGKGKAGTFQNKRGATNGRYSLVQPQHSNSGQILLPSTRTRSSMAPTSSISPGWRSALDQAFDQHTGDYDFLKDK